MGLFLFLTLIAKKNIFFIGETKVCVCWSAAAVERASVTLFFSFLSFATINTPHNKEKKKDIYAAS